MFAWGVITGVVGTLLLQEVGKAFGAWVKGKLTKKEENV